ncbi:STAS/SEC14 domain-containing protein [Roseiconus nitratireducens]|uniref:STAS/SEC14 domain-containing protein n=1 Tax=Roseiconus nitratireducens TaxID=2605748 RepID=A0A5M6DAN2_9BACT|nr:STAS/SEC14 domain-containing protein [Roseiconus nitratireducens]KAA5543059.1 STAS/SEC14 domain-containing protein [Roseiconus nitratireducens]
MPVNISETADGKVIEVEVNGKLTAADYDLFVPLTEERIRQYGKISMIIVLTDFHGWEAAALWDDLKWDVKHFTDLERLAVVGDRQWQKGVSAFCRPFTSAEIKYFDWSEREAARSWAGETAPDS